MLERRLAEQADGVRRLPFSDNVLYIFDKQLEEADIIVINKRDLLAPAGAAAVHDAAQALFPDATVILHEARDRGAAPNWLALLEEKDSADTARHPRTPRPALTLDYERYAAGEIEMAWLDEEFLLEASADSPDSPDSAGDSASRGTNRSNRHGVQLEERWRSGPPLRRMPTLRGARGNPGKGRTFHRAPQDCVGEVGWTGKAQSDAGRFSVGERSPGV
jgi:hypothetical protein